jgi:hypothetical protein
MRTRPKAASPESAVLNRKPPARQTIRALAMRAGRTIRYRCSRRTVCPIAGCPSGGATAPSPRDKPMTPSVAEPPTQARHARRRHNRPVDNMPQRS